jgi:predicted nucleotidyltransferase
MLERLYNKLPSDLKLIHAFVGGSTLHGATNQGHSDLDFYGVFLEPATKSLGLDCFEHFCTTSSGQDQRNGPSDVDINTYSLRSWANMACKGNPTALNFLFAENRVIDNDANRLWDWHRYQFREYAISKKAAKAFYGFANDQMRRLLGQKGAGKHGQRPELDKEHGYDTKAAMHALRLIGEGTELMETGVMTFPRPNKDFLIEVREGKYSLERVADMANKGLVELDIAAADSKLQETANREAMSRLVTDIYLDCYRGENYL